MLIINLEFDTNAMAAPQSFRDAVQDAANKLDTAIFDPITVNIEVGYGEYDLGGPQYEELTDSSVGGVMSAVTVSYPALRAALAANATSMAATEAVNSLPDTASLNGQSNFAISTALAKAFGVLPASNSAIDGYVGFPTSFTGNGLIGTAIAEEAHALGLSYLFGGGDLSVVAYTSPGDHFLPTGATASTPAYFSLDGGVTNLVNHAVNYDDTLFLNLPNDPLDVPSDGIALTQLDLEELSAIGFNDTSAPVVATPNITPTVTAPGTLIIVNTQNASVAENHSISALSLIKSVSEPVGDPITTYAFDDAGSGSGHFLLDGTVEPDGQYFDVLDTQLNDLKYVGGPAAGSEPIYVEALGTAPGVSSQVGALTATTTPALTAGFPPADSNGDGTSDILFQNTDGTVATWEVTAASVSASATIANPGTSWHEAGTGDFNGDGYSDILYQNDDGTVAIWEMNGPDVILGATVANPGTAWHVLGTGDFNEDGKSDILLQNNDGTVEIWNMNGATVASSAVVANPGAQWHPVGTGDFFGTGQPDILLQNDDGTIDIWQMSGDTLVNGTVIANPGPTWHAVGTGDFNGDGKSDILFQNNDGSIAIWEMDGTTVTSGVVVANPGPSWHAVSSGDYNGDGKSDILFQNDDGTVEIWQMNGTTVTAGTVVANPGTQWQTTGQGSMHFIDGTQSTGTLSGTILADNFVFTTSQQGAHIINGFDPVHDVITLNQAQFGSYAAVQAAESTVNDSTVLTLGTNNTLTINGVLPGALAAKNFV